MRAYNNCDGAARRVPLFLDIFHLNINLATAIERKRAREGMGEGEDAYSRPWVPCNRRGASRRVSPTEQEKEKPLLALCP